MCGIVGLLVKNPALRNQLGALMVPMLVGMTERGPDSAGLAVYTEPVSNRHHKLSLYSGESAVDWPELLRSVAAEFAHAHEIAAHGNHAVLTTAADPDQLSAWLARNAPTVAVLSVGQSIDLYKDVGAPADIADRYDFKSLRGSHLVGHTRMATESAVTTAHSHPFAPAADLALVHNGSFSNYATVRRRLARAGVTFDTDNDSEVAARLIASRMAAGDGLEDALKTVFKEMDGFFTLLVTTRTQFAVVRDSFACKPAVIAETSDYVAMASEYHALAGLPGITSAEVFEPMPEEIHLWSR